ncbi:hypothetical protein JHK82_052803 [Glycine max]|nr:hypothetical protein JHK85_053507 [Glycine max]KAG5085406.1 hypothetical protein JHK82_052803 [Glycine max]
MYWMLLISIVENKILEWLKMNCIQMMLSRMEVGKKGGEVNGHEKNAIGMVVIRGNSVVTIEPLEIQV